MATLFWTLLTLYPFVAHSQSGDDGESIDPDCWSLMTLTQSHLICTLTKEDLDVCVKLPTLCSVVLIDGVSECHNATMESDRVTFHDLSPILKYKLDIKLEGGRSQTQMLILGKIVKITTPEIENATYKNDEAIIHIKYQHDYVSKPDFQVEFWGDHSNSKEMMKWTEQVIRIGGHMLRDSEMYNVRVRAKPVKFFDGSWTEWSTVKTFRVNPTHVKGAEAHLVPYIFLCITPVVLVAIGLLILRWKKEIQACLFPDIPDPKATLAQIYRQKENLPVSFSPEMFKDTNIYPVIYTEEKQFTPEFGDDQCDTTESCDDEGVALQCSCPTSVCEEQDEINRSLDSATSQMEMKLLDECASAEDVNDNPGCQSVAAIQRHSNDETYVTMSSLYKTQ